MSDLFPPSLEEQIAETEREVKMRREVYGRRVAEGKMTASRADRQIKMMEAIAATLRGLKDPSRAA